MTSETVKGILFNVKRSLEIIKCDAIKAELLQVVETLDKLETKLP